MVGSEAQANPGRRWRVDPCIWVIRPRRLILPACDFRLRSKFSIIKGNGTPKITNSSVTDFKDRTVIRFSRTYLVTKICNSDCSVRAYGY